MDQPAVKRITMHYEDGSEVHFDIDNATYDWESGIVTTYTPGQMYPTALDRSGQERILVKAWKGCSSYEEFVAKEDRVL